MMIMHLAYDSFIVELTNNVSLLLPVDYIKQISQYDQKIYDDHKHIIMLIAYISQPKKKDNTPQKISKSSNGQRQLST